jgi:hypothetical protein
MSLHSSESISFMITISLAKGNYLVFEKNIHRSLWKNLVYKSSGDHISLEEEHNFKYKTHMIFTNFSYRFAWFLFFYSIAYVQFLLSEPGKIFNFAEWDHLVNPSSNDDYPTRYERFYVVDKPQKY